MRREISSINRHMENGEFIFNDFLIDKIIFIQLEDDINIFETFWSNYIGNRLHNIPRLIRSFYFESDILITHIINDKWRVVIFLSIRAHFENHFVYWNFYHNKIQFFQIIYQTSFKYVLLWIITFLNYNVY